MSQTPAPAAKPLALVDPQTGKEPKPRKGIGGLCCKKPDGKGGYLCGRRPGAES